MAWRVWLLSVAAALNATNATGTEAELSPEFSERLDLRFIGDTQEPFNWQEGVDRGIVDLDMHVIKPDDTYTSIIEEHGVRPDPVSIDLYNSINDNRYPARALPPGEVLSVVVNRAVRPLVIGIDGDFKAHIYERQTSLRNRLVDFDEWPETQGAGRDIANARTLLEGIVHNMQSFELSGYAVDRTTLGSTSEALSVVEAIAERATSGHMQPTAKELSFLRTFRDVMADVTVAARAVDRPKVPTKIATIGRTGQPKNDLTVCYENAIARDVFEFQNNGADPDWECDNAFHTLSSPARHVFKSNLVYTVWVTLGTERVSEYRDVRIEPNRTDGSFWQQLSVNIE